MLVEGKANYIKEMDFWSTRFLWIPGARLCLQSLLLTIFLFFFGLPAVEKYEKKEVMMVETSKETHGIPSPAITISARSQKQQDCKLAFDSSFERCIDSNTFNSSELLDSVVLGFRRREILNLSEVGLREDFTVLFTGKYYTLNLSLTSTPNFLEDQIILQLPRGNLISVFIHDPHFFLFNSNSDMKSMIMRKFDTGVEQSRYVNFELIERNELNVPSDPCELNPGYSFHACLRKSLSTQVFCNLCCRCFV